MHLLFVSPQASEEASLRALESLMTEFFHSCTTNERKREIGKCLEMSNNSSSLPHYSGVLIIWRVTYYIKKGTTHTISLFWMMYFLSGSCCATNKCLLWTETWRSSVRVRISSLALLPTCYSRAQWIKLKTCLSVWKAQEVGQHLMYSYCSGSVIFHQLCQH